ncbi:hypothetical protein SGLAM104S_10661 [Streptomyces glaucescens]
MHRPGGTQRFERGQAEAARFVLDEDPTDPQLSCQGREFRQGGGGVAGQCGVEVPHLPGCGSAPPRAGGAGLREPARPMGEGSVVGHMIRVGCAPMIGPANVSDLYSSENPMPGFPAGPPYGQRGERARVRSAPTAPAARTQASRHPGGRRRRAVLRPLLRLPAALPARSRGRRAAAGAGRTAGTADRAGRDPRRPHRSRPRTPGARRGGHRRVPHRPDRHPAHRRLPDRRSGPRPHRPRPAARADPQLRVHVTQLEPEQALPALAARDFDLVVAEEYPGNPSRAPPDSKRSTCSTTLFAWPSRSRPAARTPSPPAPAGRWERCARWRTIRG